MNYNFGVNITDIPRHQKKDDVLIDIVVFKLNKGVSSAKSSSYCVYLTCFLFKLLIAIDTLNYARTHE